jgi:hypothetical protein
MEALQPLLLPFLLLPLLLPSPQLLLPWRGCLARANVPISWTTSATSIGVKTTARAAGTSQSQQQRMEVSFKMEPPSFKMEPPSFKMEPPFFKMKESTGQDSTAQHRTVVWILALPSTAQHSCILCRRQLCFRMDARGGGGTGLI